ncbi:MAG: DUF1131 family protein [Parvibaculum sp.]|nr:DUF1131 family protein [Parvibaculum sp.]|tara:strand:+ start:26176 stop:26733 length:558 start_codon:yes stop_codon:yes gene_type:complete
MNLILKSAMACALAFSLYACSKPVELLVSEKGVGPVTVETPFDPEVVAKLLPSHTVEAAVSAALQPGEHTIRVSDGDKVLMELYPSGDGKMVETVLVLDASIKDNNGIHIGSTFAEAVPDGDTSECNIGRGEKEGRIFCSQPRNVHIIYEFQSAQLATDGTMPDAAALAAWTVTAMLWDGSEPAP